MTSTVVVGGGVGGLAVAVRLAAAGHHVRLVERNEVVGGKLATYAPRRLHVRHRAVALTVPHLFGELFGLAGSSPPDMVRLDPQFRYHWDDGSTLTVADDNDSTAAAFEEFAAGAGASGARSMRGAGGSGTSPSARSSPVR